MAVLNGLPVHFFCIESKLDSIEKLAGQIIVCTDTEQMYVDAADDKRIGIGSPVRVATYNDLPFAPLDKFYVTVDTGNVYLFVDDAWKQIGSDDFDLSNYVGTVSLQSNTVNGTTASFGIDTDDNVSNVYAGVSDGTNTSLVQVTKGSTLVTATDGTNTTNITVTPTGVTYNNHAENTIGGLAVIGSDGKVPSHATISSGAWSNNGGAGTAPTTDFYYSSTDGLLIKTSTGYSPVSPNVDLSGYATVNALTSGLAGKANTSDVYTIAQVNNMLSPLNSNSHSHSNKTVLDNFSSVSGGVAYNGTQLSTLTLSDVRSEIASANKLSIKVVSSLSTVSGNAFYIEYTGETGYDASATGLYEPDSPTNYPDNDIVIPYRYTVSDKVWFLFGYSPSVEAWVLLPHTGLVMDALVYGASSDSSDPTTVTTWEGNGTGTFTINPVTNTPDPNKLYLVPAENSTSGNVYDEYLYTTSGWEKIGSTETDISGYVTISALNTALAGKADSSHTHTVANITNFTTSVNSLVDSKLTSYYTKSEIDNMDFGSTVHMGGGFAGDGSEEYPYSVNLYDYFQPDMNFGNQSGGTVYLWDNGARILFESTIVFNADRWSHGVEVGYYDVATTAGRILTLKASSLADFKLQIGNNVGTANQAYGLAVIGSDGKLPASILPTTGSGVAPYLMFVAPQPEDDAEVIHLEVKYKTTIDGTESTLINTYDDINRTIVYGSSNGSSWSQCPATGFGGPQFGGCSIIANVSTLLSTSSITYLSYRWLDSTGVPYTEYMGMVYPNACGMSITSTTNGSSTPSVDLTNYVTQSELTTALSNKSDSSHTHSIYSLNDWSEGVDSVVQTYTTEWEYKFANKTHSHSISEVNGLSTALNGKTIATSISSSSTASQLPTAKAVWDAIAAIDIPESFDPSGYLTTATANSTYAKLNHEHTASEITDFNLVVENIVSAALNSLDYAASSHSHSISDITNLSTTLSGKVDTSTLINYYTKAQVDNLLSNTGSGSVDLSYYSGAVFLTCENSTMLSINYYSGTALGTYDINGELSNTTIRAGYHIDGDPLTGTNTPGFSGYISLGLQTDRGDPKAPNTAGGFAIVGENGKLPTSILPETSSSSGIRTPVLILKKPAGDDTEGYHLEVEISTDGGTTYTQIINTKTTSSDRVLVKSSSNGRVWNNCPTNGFGPQYNNCPVMVDVNGLVDPTVLTMISYRWVNTDGTSYSDWFGTVYPNATEAFA